MDLVAQQGNQGRVLRRATRQGTGRATPTALNFGKISIMSVQEIERAIAQLPENELTELMTWIQNHHHEAWDK